MAETSTGKAQISWRKPEMGLAPLLWWSAPAASSSRRGRGTEIVDLTDRCDELVARSRLAEGFVQLVCAHTTCTLVVNENERGSTRTWRASSSVSLRRIAIGPTTT